MMNTVQSTMVEQIEAAGLRRVSFVYDQNVPEQIKVNRGFKGAYIEYDRGTDTYHVQSYRVNREDLRVSFGTPKHYLMVENMIEAVKASL